MAKIENKDKDKLVLVWNGDINLGNLTRPLIRRVVYAPLNWPGIVVREGLGYLYYEHSEIIE